MENRKQKVQAPAPAEARAILRIDEKWSVEYQPDLNDAPGRVLRYGEPTFGGSSDWKNDTRAMFYALLERDVALEAQAAELAAMKAERDAAREYAMQARLRENAAEDARVSAVSRASRTEVALAEARKALKLAKQMMTKDSLCEAERLEEGLLVVRRALTGGENG